MLACILNPAKKLSRPERTQREIRSTQNVRNAKLDTGSVCPNCRGRDYSGNPHVGIHLWKSDSEISCLSYETEFPDEVDIVSLARRDFSISISSRVSARISNTSGGITHVSK